MASFVKRGSKWRAFVLENGQRHSKTFATKREAVAWANEQEQDGILARHTFKEAIDRYEPIAKELKGSQAALSRLRSLRSTSLADRALEDITAAHITAWRDSRLKEVGASSVRCEFTRIGVIFRLARDEWGWMRNDPLKTVRKPKASPPRKRGIARDEIESILGNLTKMRVGKQVAQLFRLSLETGMRLSEMLGLEWPDVAEKTVTLRDSKNGDARTIPLSLPARGIIAERRGIDPHHVFTLSAHVASKTFSRASINGVHFHDARSEAITRLSKRLDVLQLAKMIGHRDPRSLMFYYAESAESIADRL